MPEDACDPLRRIDVAAPGLQNAEQRSTPVFNALECLLDRIIYRRVHGTDVCEYVSVRNGLDSVDAGIELLFDDAVCITFRGRNG